MISKEKLQHVLNRYSCYADVLLLTIDNTSLKIHAVKKLVENRYLGKARFIYCFEFPCVVDIKGTSEYIVNITDLVDFLSQVVLSVNIRVEDNQLWIYEKRHALCIPLSRKSDKLTTTDISSLCVDNLYSYVQNNVHVENDSMLTYTQGDLTLKTSLSVLKCICNSHNVLKFDALRSDRKLVIYMDSSNKSECLLVEPIDI